MRRKACVRQDEECSHNAGSHADSLSGTQGIKVFKDKKIVRGVNSKKVKSDSIA